MLVSLISVDELGAMNVADSYGARAPIEAIAELDMTDPPIVIDSDEAAAAEARNVTVYVAPACIVAFVEALAPGSSDRMYDPA